MSERTSKRAASVRERERESGAAGTDGRKEGRKDCITTLLLESAGMGGREGGRAGCLGLAWPGGTIAPNTAAKQGKQQASILSLSALFYIQLENELLCSCVRTYVGSRQYYIRSNWGVSVRQRKKETYFEVTIRVIIIFGSVGQPEGKEGEEYIFLLPSTQESRWPILSEKKSNFVAAAASIREKILRK